MASEKETGRAKGSILKIVVSVALIVGALAYLLGGSLTESMVYDRTVDQVLAEADGLSGQQIRVGGRLAQDTLDTDPDRGEHTFALAGTDRPLQVRYRGHWPDAAVDGRELMIEGTLLENGTVQADRVLARCPSRYKQRVSQEEQQP